MAQERAVTGQALPGHPNNSQSGSGCSSWTYGTG